MFTYYRYSVGSKLIRLVILAWLALPILLLISAQPVFAAPVISNIAVSNVRDTTFTVSWTTDVVVTGTINYGTTTALGSIGNDDRGASTSSTTHYVTVSGLNLNTQFYFDVLSGTTVANNGGSHFTVTTGPTLSLPASDTVYGQVFKVDHATLAVGTIVLIKIVDGNATGSPGSSAMVSALVDGTGYWYYNLGNVRTADPSSYFSYSPAGGDNLQLYAYGGADGNTSLSVSTSSDKPTASMYLAGVATAVTVFNFVGSSGDSSASSSDFSGDVILVLLALSSGIAGLAGVWLNRKRGHAR